MAAYCRPSPRIRFGEIQKWLPFGLGQKTANVVEALIVLLGETPNTLAGLDSQVAQPLDHWLAGGDGEAPLKSQVIQPIQEKVLAKTSAALTKAERVQVTYKTNLEEPAVSVITKHSQIRALIADYRRRHQL